jgi:hypothetical protein
MAKDSLKLGVEIDNAKTVTELAQKIRLLEDSVRNHTKSQADGYNTLLKYRYELEKQTLSLEAQSKILPQLTQAQIRVANGWNSMSGSLGQLNSNVHQLTQNSNRAQQGLMAFSYILQDLPYGIRGVANNITQLSQVIGTPMWINIGISALTSLMVVMSNTKDQAEKTARAVAQANDDISASFDKFDKEFLQRQHRMNLHQIRQYESGQVEQGAQLQFIGGFLPVFTPTVKLNSKFQEFITMLKSWNKQIEDEFNRRDKESERRAEKNKKKDEEEAYWASVRSRLVAGGASTAYSGGGIGAMGGGVGLGYQFQQASMMPRLLSIQQAQVNNEFYDSSKMIQTTFFDPMLNGFNDLNSVIRNELFGTLEEMKNRFGVLGAAVIQAVNSIIAKIVELSIASLAVVALSGGTFGIGDFLNIFKMIAGGKESAGSLLGFDSGGWVNEPVIGRGLKSGRAYSFAENNPEYVVNPRRVNNSLMAGMGGGIQTVRVVGKLSGRDILIASETEKAYSSSRW